MRKKTKAEIKQLIKEQASLTKRDVLYEVPRLKTAFFTWINGQYYECEATTEEIIDALLTYLDVHIEIKRKSRCVVVKKIEKK